MLFQHFSSTIDVISAKIDAFTDQKNWELKLLVFCVLYIFITSFPTYGDLIYPSFLEHQSKHLLELLPPEYLSNGHLQKHQFRLFIPFILKLIPLNALWLLGLQYAFSTLLLFLTCRISTTLTKNKSIGVLTTILVSSIAIGKVGFYDVFWHFDSVAIALLLLAIAFERPWVIFSCILASAFTDERGFVASSLIFCYYALKATGQQWDFAKILKDSKIWTIIAAWVIYLGIRFSLMYFCGFATETEAVGLSIIRANYNLMPLSFLFIFEAGWVFIAWQLCLLWKNNKLISLAIAGAILAVFVVSLAVSDVSRSTAYMCPLLFIAFLCHAQNKFSSISLKKALVPLTLFCMLIPTQEFFDYQVYWYGPILPKVLKYL